MEDGWRSTKYDWLSLEDDWLPVAPPWTPTESVWVQFLEDLSSPHLEQNYLAEPEFDKFFVITCHTCHYFIEHCVFLVDINAKSNIYKYPMPQLDPVVRFGLPRGHEVFSIIGTKLYMFGFLKYDKRTPTWSKKMSIYDMSTALYSGKTIDLSNQGIDVDLSNGPEMTAGKQCPISVVIGGSKICVFSSVLYSKPSNSYGCTDPLHECYLGPNFEVYDTSKGCWIVLPEPCEEYDKLDLPKSQNSVVVESYCVHRSSLVIQSSNLGIFGINVDNPNPKWVKMDGSESIKKFPLTGMWTMVDKQLCNPFMVVQRGDLTSCPLRFEDPTDRESLIEESQSGVLCLGGGGGVNNNCIVVRGGLCYSDSPVEKRAPNLLVDKAKFDAEGMTELGSYFCELLEVQSDRSFNFALNSTPSVKMTVIGCFPLKLTLESGEQSLYFANSQIKGATANGFFGRHQAESHGTVTNGHAVGLPRRFKQVLLSLLG